MWDSKPDPYYDSCMGYHWTSSVGTKWSFEAKPWISSEQEDYGIVRIAEFGTFISQELHSEALGR